MMIISPQSLPEKFPSEISRIHECNNCQTSCDQIWLGIVLWVCFFLWTSVKSKEEAKCKEEFAMGLMCLPASCCTFYSRPLRVPSTIFSCWIFLRCGSRLPSLRLSSLSEVYRFGSERYFIDYISNSAAWHTFLPFPNPASHRPFPWCLPTLVHLALSKPGEINCMPLHSNFYFRCRRQKMTNFLVMDWPMMRSLNLRLF